ncbi:unnamed protein product, partial [Vitis vinifera]
MLFLFKTEDQEGSFGNQTNRLEKIKKTTWHGATTPIFSTRTCALQIQPVYHPTVFKLHAPTSTTTTASRCSMASISFSGESLISLLTLFSLLFLTHATLHLHPSDYDALLLIQKHLGINGQRRSSPNPCNTPGVFCERRVSDNATVLRVTRLVFKSQRLSGFLSPQIGRLSQLKELSLPDNYLLDRIPSQIVDCRKLEILDLRNNRFSGEIPPELSSLVRLRILDLSSNKFSGNLNFLRFFPNLEKLSLAENLFSGKVPVSVRSFRNLRVFNLSGNSFLEGPVPGMREVEVESLASALPRRYVFAENLTRGSSNHSAVAPSGMCSMKTSFKYGIKDIHKLGNIAISSWEEIGTPG